MAAAPMRLPLALVLFCIASLQLQLHCQTVSASGYDTTWRSARATWYGGADGDGSDGGNCGYGTLSGSPYGSSIAAGSAPIYDSGFGCGACYEIQCSDSLCKPTPTNVVITDLCPGGEFCGNGQTHFDLSGTAFGEMATSGQADALRTVGVLNIQFKRVPCSYSSQLVTFTVDSGSNSVWISLIVKYEAGPGDLQSVDIQEAGSSQWQSMTHNWGANWEFQSTTGSALQGPLSIRLTAKLDGQVVVATNVIPNNYAPGASYPSSMQFQ